MLITIDKIYSLKYCTNDAKNKSTIINIIPFISFVLL